jgi:hypothetical protein
VPTFINWLHWISFTKSSKAASRTILWHGWRSTSIMFMAKGRLNVEWTTSIDDLLPLLPSLVCDVFHRVVDSNNGPGMTLRHSWRYIFFLIDIRFVDWYITVQWHLDISTCNRRPRTDRRHPHVSRVFGVLLSHSKERHHRGHNLTNRRCTMSLSSLSLNISSVRHCPYILTPLSALDEALSWPYPSIWSAK